MDAPAPLPPDVLAALPPAVVALIQWQAEQIFVHVVTDTKSNGFVKRPRKVEVRLRAPLGTSDVRIGKESTIETPSVGTVIIDTVFPCRAAQGPLPEGPYQAEVWINEVRTLQLNWAVRVGASRPGKTVRLQEFEISNKRLTELAKDHDLMGRAITITRSAGRPTSTPCETAG